MASFEAVGQPATGWSGDMSLGSAGSRDAPPGAWAEWAETSPFPLNSSYSCYLAKLGEKLVFLPILPKAGRGAYGKKSEKKFDVPSDTPSGWCRKARPHQTATPLFPLVMPAREPIRLLNAFTLCGTFIPEVRAQWR